MGRQVFIVISFLLLLASIPFGVFLVKEQFNLKSDAYTPKQSRIEFLGNGVSDLRTTSKSVVIRIYYVPTNPSSPIYPTHLRIANNLDSINQAGEIDYKHPFTQVNWTLPSGNGPKVVFVQFKIDNSWTPTLSSSIVLESSDENNASASTSTSPTASPINNQKYDLNTDGVLNSLDLEIVMTKIKTGQVSIGDTADLNKDGAVNNLDYSEILRALN